MIASRWNPSWRQVAAASHGPTGHGLRSEARGPAGISRPSVARSRDRCSALLQDLATRGKTVFVSSHLMSEIAQTAAHLIVIGRGRLIADTSVADFIASAAPPVVRVLSSDQRALAGLLRSPNVTVTPADDGALLISGLSAGPVGATAAAAGITVFELATEQASLEDAFVDL